MLTIEFEFLNKRSELLSPSRGGRLLCQEIVLDCRTLIENALHCLSEFLFLH